MQPRSSLPSQGKKNADPLEEASAQKVAGAETKGGRGAQAHTPLAVRSSQGGGCGHERGSARERWRPWLHLELEEEKGCDLTCHV